MLEDEPFARSRVEQALSEQFSNVQIRSTGYFDEALHLSLTETFDCLILDRQVYGGDGLKLLDRLKERSIEVPAIVISNLNDIDQRVEGLDAGADDYLGKAFEAKELAARLRAAVRRSKQRDDPNIIKFLDLDLHKGGEIAEWRGEKLGLKPKEFRLLLSIIEAYPEDISYGQIWDQVWGSDFANLPPQKPVIHTTLARLRRNMKNINNFSILSVSGSYRVEITK
ncbi:MAG: response regulator transcription factor [Nonlabens ulvanivorans]